MRHNLVLKLETSGLKVQTVANRMCAPLCTVLVFSMSDRPARRQVADAKGPAKFDAKKASGATYNLWCVAVLDVGCE